MPSPTSYPRNENHHLGVDLLSGEKLDYLGGLLRLKYTESLLPNASGDDANSIKQRIKEIDNSTPFNERSLEGQRDMEMITIQLALFILCGDDQSVSTILPKRSGESESSDKTALQEVVSYYVDLCDKLVESEIKNGTPNQPQNDKLKTEIHVLGIIRTILEQHRDHDFIEALNQYYIEDAHLHRNETLLSTLEFLEHDPNSLYTYIRFETDREDFVNDPSITPLKPDLSFLKS